jgi:hypothetical protein
MSRVGVVGIPRTNAEGNPTKYHTHIRFASGELGLARSAQWSLPAASRLPRIADELLQRGSPQLRAKARSDARPGGQTAALNEEELGAATLILPAHRSKPW